MVYLDASEGAIGAGEMPPGIKPRCLDRPKISMRFVQQVIIAFGTTLVILIDSTL